MLVLVTLGGAALIGLTHKDSPRQSQTRSLAKGPSSTAAKPAASGAAPVKGGAGNPESARSRSEQPSDPGVLDASSADSFAQLEASLPGHVELAVAPLGQGHTETLGGQYPAHGWSTTKIPVLVSVLLMRGSRGLTEGERSLAESAVTESNNEAALALFAELEEADGGLVGASRHIESVLRLGGDMTTTVATAPPPPGAITTFGQTEWSPASSVRFFRSLVLGCLLPETATRYVLGLMERIESSESWGLGSAGFMRVAFKGGWGPEAGGYLVRQTGVVDPGTDRGVVVATVARAPSFAEGAKMLTQTAIWLRQHLVLVPRPVRGCSG